MCQLATHRKERGRVSWGRALWAIIAVAVLYLAVAGVVVLLAGMGQMAWAAAIHVAKTSASISSLAVGVLLGFYLGYGPS